MSAAEGGPVRIGDRYRVEERIGTGAMGVVWRAVDELLSRTVAMKELLAVRPAGLTDSAITKLFGNHIISPDKEAALELLKVQERAHTRKVKNPAGDRLIGQWFYGPLPSEMAKEAKEAKQVPES